MNQATIGRMVMSNPKVLIALLTLWIALAGFYVASALRQMNALNLSATAGGQYPYLNYAQGLAEEGLFTYLGDRNRMPLVPAALSIAADEDTEVFAKRAVWLGLALSLVALTMVGMVSYRFLPPLPASILLASATLGLFPAKAGFVQAEHLFYALFFASVTLLIRLMAAPGWRMGLLTGVTLGLAYLTKASAWPLFVITLTVLAIRAVYRAIRRTAGTEDQASLAGNEADELEQNELKRRMAGWRGDFFAAVFVLVGFVSLTWSYQLENIRRFGQPAYNVNAQYYMWADSWGEATAHKWPLHQKLPPAELLSELPTASRYWRTHSLSQTWLRIAYGYRELGRLLTRSSYGLHLIAAVIACGVVLALRRDRWRFFRQWTANAILGLLIVGLYLTAYAFYVPVAYGDRFIRSLYLPVMAGVLWLSWCREGRQERGSDSLRPASSLRGMFSTVVYAGLLVFVLVEGTWRALVVHPKPTREFVRFYYNETQELLLRGEAAGAVGGFEGVLALDRDFVPARRSLGVALLQLGRASEAIDHLEAARAGDSDHIDTYNSLGGAYAAVGRFEEAVDAFVYVIEHSVDDRMARFNLGATYAQMGEFAKAWEVADDLSAFHEDLSNKLRAGIEEMEREKVRDDQ